MVYRFLLAVVATSVICVFVQACTPSRSLPQISTREVPDPFVRSTQDASDDSLVRAKWMCRTTVPDPLAGQEDGPKIRFEATLYGEDVIVAEVVKECRGPAGLVASDTCVSASRERYRSVHRDDTRLRIRLDLESSFSVNSLNSRFWDVYLKDERGIAYEPVEIVQNAPVIVREDTLPEPGRAPVRGAVYRRAIDMYFPREDAFGTDVISSSTREVRLVVSQNRRELTTFVWRIKRTGDSGTTRTGSAQRAPSGF
ncbi:MAG TPA: hypothetical protein PLG27_01830 [Candidatus Latescibacteria bacterium]|nr:hypothetical protein [Candidatus Latescibacterota bacterium]HOM56471.1 hypothetical protein [Candidatus Latescibacterota bacterium]HOS65125.1 hypothetical protein [Candidatus Latescibacterota bacterium]HPC45188.1 hypothetical protein [Candidatus Latescibacterota bacterium]HPK74299.1 hypothetical protein [Candidatus Latescibacterota bacterium]